MPRKHQNDVPGDVVAGRAENLAGAFGYDDPDANLDATVDQLTDNDVLAPSGEGFFRQGERGGITAGTDYAEAVDEGMSVDREDLAE
jgi:hypothetical protein